MSLSYNRAAGQNLGRLAGLSDGVFAVAMTLLVLDLHVPEPAAIHSERELALALAALTPRLVPYLMSFLTLGIFWIGQQTQLNNFSRTDRSLVWIHVAFLFAVSVTPFSTALLASFVTYRTALLVYWFDIFLLGATLLWSWRYAASASLVREDAPAGLGSAIQRRILVAQALYGVGALLCILNTYWSIGFIVALQLNYALGLRWPKALAH